MRGVPGVAAADSIGAVEAAIGGGRSQGGRSRHGVAADFLSAPLTPALRRLGVLYGLYLCFTSLRIQEVIPALAIPKLPMAMALALAAGLVSAVPGSGWTALWRAAPALRWQTLLVVLAIVTIPLSIWIGNSVDQLYPGYFISVTVFLAGLTLLRDRASMVRILLILLGALVVITSIIFLGGGGAAGRIGLGSSLDSNDYAWVLATCIPIALWLGVRRKATAILWFGVAILLALGLVRTQSRGGFLALLAMAVVLISFGATGWRRVAMFVAIAVLGAGVLAYIDASGASRLTDFSGYTGGTGRTELWKQGIRWMVQRPWGYGMGNYATYNVWMTRDYHAGHSAYVNIGVELGILGAVAYFAIWIGAARGVLTARRNAIAALGQPGAAEEATLLGFMVAMMAGNAVGSAFINTQYSALTLFVQALATAAWLGSPFRGAAPSTMAAAPANGQRPGRGGAATRGAPAAAAVPPGRHEGRNR
jgi:hypothetical protein